MIPQRQAVDLGGEHQLEADRPDRARILQAEVVAHQLRGLGMERDLVVPA